MNAAAARCNYFELKMPFFTPDNGTSCLEPKELSVSAGHFFALEGLSS
jgi:hypothetical protein